MGCDDGNATAQTVLLLPLLISVLLLVVLCGRLVETALRIGTASQDAARAASLARTAEAAQTAARQSAAQDLGGGGSSCASYTVIVDTVAFRPGGSVRVSIKCFASLGGLSGLGVPGSVGVSSHSVSVIEPYRGAS